MKPALDDLDTGAGNSTTANAATNTTVGQLIQGGE